MRLKVARKKLSSNAFVYLSVILLFLPLFRVAGYNFTFGTAAAFFLVAAALPQMIRRPRAPALLCLAWSWPLAIYLGHIVLRTPYALGLFDFASSYAIWTLSSLLIWMGFQDRPKFCDANWTALLVLVSGFAVLQYIDYHYGSRALTEAIKGLGIYNPLVYDKSGIELAENYRAIGTYYEPSMLGRIAVTIGAIVLMLRGRLVLVALCIAAVLFVSRSLSVVVLGVGMFGLLHTRATSRLLLVIAGLVIGYFVFGAFIASRLDISRGNPFSSTYIRLVMPWYAVENVLPRFPLGVPIGANEAVVNNVIARRYALHEPKITNGLYEFVLYFGFPGAFLALWMLGVTGWCALLARPTAALIGFFLLFSTAASSSYLSLESSLLLYLLIGTLRQARAARAGPAVTPPRHAPLSGDDANGAPARPCEAAAPRDIAGRRTCG